MTLNQIPLKNQIFSFWGSFNYYYYISSFTKIENADERGEIKKTEKKNGITAMKNEAVKQIYKEGRDHRRTRISMSLTCNNQKNSSKFPKKKTKNLNCCSCFSLSLSKNVVVFLSLL